MLNFKMWMYTQLSLRQKHSHVTSDLHKFDQPLQAHKTLPHCTGGTKLHTITCDVHEPLPVTTSCLEAAVPPQFTTACGALPYIRCPYVHSKYLVL